MKLKSQRKAKQKSIIWEGKKHNIKALREAKHCSKMTGDQPNICCESDTARTEKVRHTQNFNPAKDIKSINAKSQGSSFSMSPVWKLHKVE